MVGEHRAVVGCPRGEWDREAGRRRVGTRAQAVLHPREEAPALIAQARERGIPVLEVPKVEMEQQVQVKSPEELLEDAERLYQEALRLLSGGDYRDASEKAWGATLAMGNAVVGAFHRRAGRQRGFLEAGVVRRELWSWADRLPRLRRAITDFLERFGNREGKLHALCFYQGWCDEEEVAWLIRETGTLLELARRLVSEVGA